MRPSPSEWAEQVYAAYRADSTPLEATESAHVETDE